MLGAWRLVGGGTDHVAQYQNGWCSKMVEGRKVVVASVRRVCDWRSERSRKESNE